MTRKRRCAIIAGLMALSALPARAEQQKAAHFTVAQLEAACASDEDEAVGLCKGFAIGAFETALSFGTELGSPACLKGRIDAASLAKLISGRLAAVGKAAMNAPALPLAVRIIQREFPCPR